MKRTQRLLLALAIVLTGTISGVSAQIYVSIRPSRPVYVRSVAPSPQHIWIEEDWNGRGDRYEWSGGYWAAPPQPGYRYRQGHWNHSSRGDRWTPGRWDNGRPRGHGNNGHGNNGHGNKGHGNNGNKHGR